MNINYVQFDDGPYEFVREYVQAHGLKYFDSGAFGSVYTYRCSQKRRRIVKAIVLSTDDVKYDGYLAYFKRVILKQQNNPFVPHIYNIEAYKVLNVEFREQHLVVFIEMERLYHAKVRTLERLIKKILPFYKGNRGSYQAVLNYDDLLKGATVSQNKCFRELSKQLLRLLDKFELDLHLGNIMFRRKGRGYQFVLTDPVV